MAIQFLNSIDLNHNQLIRGVVHSDSSDPSSGLVAGQLFYNTSDGGSLKYVNGAGNWVTISTGSYTLPLAASGTRGGVQIGYTANNKNYPVQLSSEKMFVNVPWTDTHSLTTAEVEDIVGAMMDGTETLISVSYDATNNNLDFVVDNDLANYDNSTSGFITATLTDSYVRGLFSASGLVAISADGAITTTANNYSLPEATTTGRGGIELFSDTDQSVAANSVSTTENRTYGLQLNSDGQGVVNVPWDANTNVRPTETEIKDLLAGLNSSDTLSIGDADNDTTVNIRGNLTVSGTTTTINSTDLEITDKLIVVAKGATTLSAANGAGLQFGKHSTSAPTIKWDNGNTRLVSNKVFAATSFVGDVAGNATTATALAATKTIGGVDFDGSANIDLPGVNTAGNQSTTGNAATATAATTAGTVTTAAQTAITSVGTLSGLTVTAAISGSVTGSSGSTTGTAASISGITNANIVQKAATQTLTNKSIVATQLTGTIDAARLPALANKFILARATTDVAGNSGENNASTVYTVTHGFNMQGLSTKVYQAASPYQEVFVEVKYPTTTTASYTFGTAPNDGAYVAVIQTN
jgi:hypothetical protein